MKNSKPYVTQYCNLCLEWHSKKITIDDVSIQEADYLQALREKAIKQSGLTLNELDLICMCRQYGIIQPVYGYAYKIRKL